MHAGTVVIANVVAATYLREIREHCEVGFRCCRREGIHFGLFSTRITISHVLLAEKHPRMPTARRRFLTQ